MKTLYIYILSALALMNLISCDNLTKQLGDIDIYQGDKIIVHGYISPSEGVEVLAKRTLAPNNENGNDVLQNPQITLYEDGREIGHLQAIDQYNFVASDDVEIKIGHSYSIRVSADNVDEAFASQTIGAPTPIDSIFGYWDESNRNLHYYNLKTYFSIPENYKGNYALKINNFIDEDYLEEFGQRFYISDEMRHLGSGNSCMTKTFQFESDSIDIELYTLSPELSEFIITYIDSYFALDEEFVEIPYPVVGNVEGGYGVFGAYSKCATRIANDRINEMPIRSRIFYDRNGDTVKYTVVNDTIWYDKKNYGIKTSLIYITPDGETKELYEGGFLHTRGSVLSYRDCNGNSYSDCNEVVVGSNDINFDWSIIDESDND